MIGGGGHASVLAEILLLQRREILAVISPECINHRAVFKGVTHLKNDEDVLEFNKDQVLLVNGIGMAPKSNLKRKVNEYFLSLGYKFETVISNSATVSRFAKIETGSQILPSAIIQTGAVVGQHSIVNTAAIVEHDTRIGNYCHVAPRATLCGQVEVGASVYVGAGATVIQGVTLASGCIVGAGTTIVSNVKPFTITFSKLNQKAKSIGYDK